MRSASLAALPLAFLLASSASAVVIHTDHSADVREVSTSVTTTNWLDQTLTLQTIPGEAWSNLALTTRGRKYNYSTPYGTGTIWEGRIETGQSKVNILPTDSDWKYEVLRHPMGVNIGSAGQFVADNLNPPVMASRRHYVHPAGEGLELLLGGFSTATLNNPPPVSGYFGFVLTDPLNQKRYGWMHAETYITDSIVRVRVQQWACEMIPNVAISTGNTGPSAASIPLNTSTSQLVSPTTMAQSPDGAVRIYANGSTSATITGLYQLASGSDLWEALASHAPVQSLFDFRVSGIDAGESFAVVFDIGPDLHNQFNVWHVDDSLSAHQLDPSAYSYVGGLLIIHSVSNFSAYGITAVPEPVSTLLLSVAGACLMLRRPRQAHGA